MNDSDQEWEDDWIKSQRKDSSTDPPTNITDLTLEDLIPFNFDSDKSAKINIDKQKKEANTIKDDQKDLNNHRQNVTNYSIPASTSMQDLYSNIFGHAACSVKRTVKSSCDQIHSIKDLIQYYQLRITGYKNIRFNRTTLHNLYNIYANIFGWKPLTRKEKRNKDLVFKHLFSNKDLVIGITEKNPSILVQVLLDRGK